MPLPLPPARLVFERKDITYLEFLPPGHTTAVAGRVMEVEGLGLYMCVGALGAGVEPGDAEVRTGDGVKGADGFGREGGDGLGGRWDVFGLL